MLQDLLSQTATAAGNLGLYGGTIQAFTTECVDKETVGRPGTATSTKILIKSFTFAPVLFENILKMFSNWIHRAVAVGLQIFPVVIGLRSR